MTAMKDPTVQVVNAGHVVTLDPAIFEHGVVFLGKDMPPIRLTFDLDPSGNITGYSFNEIPFESPMVKSFYFPDVRRPAPPQEGSLILKKAPKLVI